MMSHRCTVLHLLLFAIGLVPYSSGASDNFYRHGVAFNASSAICIPARDKPDEVDTFFNAWLDVLPDIQTICLLCTSERDPRPTCLRRAEATELGRVHVRNDVRYARRPHFGPGFRRVRDVGPVRLRLL
ncbi:hypothetical protein chiPu_0025322 [Chiloscyllium punctatum]|uniref:Secreted protein n=1 Tax=Chiloscyllium punctatum TaxID=137246 RepID=A0A401TEM6_CHIPU|nr:hypothetical protein [Chiloscyllium punctatum]